MPENKPHPNADELMRQLSTDLAEGRITLEQMRERLKADAERPIDVDMVRTFCDGYEQGLLAYSAMRQTIIGIATDQRDPDAWRRRETEVDAHVDHMTAKLPLWKEQVQKVGEFLVELRASSGQGPVRLNDESGSTAHLLADRIMDMAAQGWRSCKEIAHRSRTDPAYQYATSASKLFYAETMQTLPKPNDLMGLVQLERAAAMKALRDGQQPQRTGSPHPSSSVNIQAETVSITGQSVNLMADQIARNASIPEQKPPKQRIKSEVVEPLIVAHLTRRPHNTAQQVAKQVGCSSGLVVQSKAWKLNRDRLAIAKREGIDPKAVKLDEEAVNAAGGSIRRQKHYHKERTEAIDNEIDARDQELGRRIGEYLEDHPGATPQQVASALRDLGCTAGDVERRQAVLEQLMKEQSDDQEEDINSEDSATKRGTHRRWTRKEV